MIPDNEQMDNEEKSIDKHEEKDQVDQNFILKRNGFRDKENINNIDNKIKSSE